METYTVGFDRNGPKIGIVIARNSVGERIVASTAGDADNLDQIIAQDPIGQSGNISTRDGLNIFEL